MLIRWATHNTHLFPRYLDDDFPSAPIVYRICEPAPYESVNEYLWFIDRMRVELRAQKQEVRNDKRLALDAHNNSEYMKGILIRRDI